MLFFTSIILAKISLTNIWNEEQVWKRGKENWEIFFIVLFYHVKF